MGILTGFWDLDKKLEGGLKEGNLYFLGARPGMGKTMLAINMIDHICGDEKRSALLFSLELSRKQVLERFISLEGQLGYRKLTEGRIHAEDWVSIIQAAEHMKEMNVLIDDSQGLSIEEFREKCIQYKALYKDLSAVFIDYIQLMSVPKHFTSMNEGLSYIISGLKKVATEFGIPVVAISQLPRSVENHEDHIPLMKDLDEMMDSDEDTDVVMFLYRDDYYSNDTKNKGIADIIVAKNHGGSRGICKLGYYPDIMRLANLKE